MPRRVTKVSMRESSMTLKAKALKLGISPYDLKWLEAIQRAGSEGVQWGPLPKAITERLHRLGYIVVLAPVAVWAKEHAPLTK